jgi:hypothetical protein
MNDATYRALIEYGEELGLTADEAMDAVGRNYCQSVDCDCYIEARSDIRFAAEMKTKEQDDCRSEELAESIVYDFTGTERTATFDGYDGAPDARGKYSLIGYGQTQEAAKGDLLGKV